MSEVQYTLEWLLPYVRRIQARGNIDYRTFADHLWAQLEEAGVPGVCRTSQFHAGSGRTFQYDAFPMDIKNATVESWFYLFRNGFIAPAAPDDYLQSPNLYRMNVTERGLGWFDGSEPIPEDAHSYLVLLKGLVPKLDPVIEQYVTESLVAFNRGAYFAAAVMLGAGSEKAIYLLAEALLCAFTDPRRREKLEALLKRRKLFDLLDAVSKSICEASNIPYEVAEGSEAHLISLCEAIRVQRNDAVHPMNATVSAELVRMTIVAFPHALAKIEELRSWFIEHPKSF